jgi:hypothetical protein
MEWNERKGGNIRKCGTGNPFGNNNIKILFTKEVDADYITVVKCGLPRMQFAVLKYCMLRNISGWKWEEGDKRLVKTVKWRAL